MLSFESDYICGAHPKVLKRLEETNLDPQPGYGNDIYCEKAKQKILRACQYENAEIFFLTGGTQANQVVTSTMLDCDEAVVAVKTGHISLHEAGAIERCGHKVIELEGVDGKMQADVLEEYLLGYEADENQGFMVRPALCYISHPTEYGTLYTHQELTELSEVCFRHNMKLYLDGARLGYGLESDETDVTLFDICNACDVFTIGGTKVGALCGEALVFTMGDTPKNFWRKVKQHGAMLAKGRLLGVQFDALFTDNLYQKISRNGIKMAKKMVKIFEDKGYEFFLKTPTNQQFLILENKKMEKLQKKVRFSFWEPYDEEHTVVRFATSWSTTDDDLKALEKIL